jgi:hypothetical protein
VAEADNSIFTKKATDKLRSPDDLDEYVRVTNPSVWVVLAACIVLLVGLFAWAVFGTAEYTPWLSLTRPPVCLGAGALASVSRSLPAMYGVPL